MPKRYQIELTKEELERTKIPLNHILVKMLHSSEGAKSKGGVVVGFLVDDTFENDDGHAASLAEVYGEVFRVPDKLFFDPDDPKSLDVDVDMELQVGDTVWFDIMEAKNSCEFLCGNTLFKSIPYYACYVAKRTREMKPVPDEGMIKSIKTESIICLNGYVLLSPINLPQISPLDVISEDQIDKTRGIIAFIGNAPKAYLRDEYSHIEDLKVGDEVILDKKTPIVWLERTVALARFDNDNLYFVVPRRKISMVINR